MKPAFFSITELAILCGVLSSAQIPDVRPQIVGRAVREGQVTTVYLAPRFATGIRMPDAVNSVVLGDPESFSAEHSEREPQIVFVKPITPKPAQTNLLISTARGHQANLLLISRGAPAGAQPSIDFLMRYRPAGRFIIESSSPSVSVAHTAALSAKGENPAPVQGAHAARGERSAIGRTDEVIPVESGSHAAIPAAGYGSPMSRDSSSDLDLLLERQKRAPLPVLYGEKPGIAQAGKQILKTGVSEVIDQGSEVVVLFSVLNVQEHAVELVPPQVQLAGQMKKGAILRRRVWSNSEQLPVEEFRMSRRRLGPGERADGVVFFRRPSFKQSNETLLLQIADSGAVDRPALAPIGFGISSIRREGEE
jgi:hypothetical protein